MMKNIKLARRLSVMLLAMLMMVPIAISVVPMGMQQAEAGVSGPMYAPLHLGEVIDHWTSDIAPGVTKTTIDVESDLGPKKVFVLDVEVSDSVISFEVGLSNGKILGMQPVSEQAKAVSKEGHAVVGGVNADFHCTSTGFPLGIVLREGRILSSPNQFPAIGFLKDGRAIIGYPVLEVDYSVPEATYRTNHINHINHISHINKPSSAALVLYTADYGDSTQTDEQYTEVILKKREGQVKSGSKLIGIVQRVVIGQGDHRLDENTFVLSSAGTAAEALKDLKTGSVVEVSFNLIGEWYAVQEAVGGSMILLENGIVTSATLRYQAPAPRTAVGLRADGSMLLAVVDGHAPDHSEGINAGQLAQLMKDLGAVSALKLDGGGSSTQIARIPGDSQASVFNRPSRSTERGVANSLLVISKAESGELSQLAVFPERVRILAGGIANFKAKGMDAAFNPAPLHNETTWKTENNIGAIDSGGTFTAGANAALGNVRAIAGAATGSAKVIVVDELTELVFPQKKMTVNPGSRVSFKVQAYKDGKLVIADSSQFKWEVTGDIGSVDEQGVLTVVSKETSGTITASYGQVSAYVELETAGFSGMEKPATQNIITLTIGEATVSVSGTQQMLDAKPYIQTATGRTMVPVRFVSKMLGAAVAWDDQTRQVEIIDGAQTIILTIGSETVVAGGTTLTIDSVPEIQPPGRTFVPLRFISETLGAQVHYDETTKQITITR